MSQKVNPKGFRLGEKTQFQTWESIWFSDPKKGKQKYSQLFHEDLTIKEYLKGFFRTFNFYVDKTVICRKINGDINLVSYVYRPAGILLRQKGPGRSDSFFYANPKEKQLHEGLDQGWIPFSVLKIIGKHILWRFEASGLSKGTGHSRESITARVAGIFPLQNRKWTEAKKKEGESRILQQPSLSFLVSNQDNLDINQRTQELRFKKDWIYSSVSSFSGEENRKSNLKEPKEKTFGVSHSSAKGSYGKTMTSFNWWKTRSWKSSLLLPCFEKGNNVATETLHPYGAEEIINMKWTIKPVSSLTNSAQLLGDFLADKIEQSTPIQMLFQEIILLFEQEAICVGSAFRNEKSDQKTMVATSLSSGPVLTGRKGDKNTPLDAHLPSGASDPSGAPAGHSKDEYGGEKAIVEGFRIICTGRLQMSPRSKPAEKAESVILNRGVLPLNSFKENIDFKQTYATNAYGTIGIKVWVNYVSRPSASGN